MQVWSTKPRDMHPRHLAAYAQRSEALGFDGLTVSEGVHDGFVNASVALAATRQLRVATAIVVAFPRSPMICAYAAWDLQSMSDGRFILGLGTQVRANIEQRFSTPWTAPVPRMREYVRALRAIWDCWQHGTPLDFQGEHYRFSRMQPYFNPGPIEPPAPKIYLGAVGPAMTRLVGEVADGMFTHASNSDWKTLREVTIPAIQEGLKKSSRPQDAVELMVAGNVITGASRDEIARSRDQHRRQLAVMFSTPNYWKALELRGWHDLGPRLRDLTRENRWSDLPTHVTDDVLAQLIPTGTYDEVVPILREWYGDLPVSVRFPLPEDPANDKLAARAIAALRA